MAECNHGALFSLHVAGMGGSCAFAQQIVNTIRAFAASSRCGKALLYNQPSYSRCLYCVERVVMMLSSAAVAWVFLLQGLLLCEANTPENNLEGEDVGIIDQLALTIRADDP